MIEDTIKHIPFKEVPEEKVIIGGNLVKWYGGFDSLMVSQNFNLPVWVPQMGRMKREELQVETLNHLPYMQWNDWMEALSDFKFGVHLMPTAAAGTFAMNCAYWGIPCIGNELVDTQNRLFPELSAPTNRIGVAMSMAIQLKNDESYYRMIRERCRKMWRLYYSESVWLNSWKEITDSIMSR